MKSYFLRTFGRNQREITCECERSNQPSLVQVLALANRLLAAEGRRKQLVPTQADGPEARIQRCPDGDAELALAERAVTSDRALKNALGVRDGEKGPLVIEAVKTAVQVKTWSGERITEVLIVIRERQADGTMKAYVIVYFTGSLPSWTD